MQKQPLLSIAIPTYNRAVFLQNLLENIVPQVKVFEGLVNVCVSNNGSADNTRQVVMDFQVKYPDLITYHENEQNLGFDGNVLKVLAMAQGSFVWLMGDDDLVVDGGIKKVIDFIHSQSSEIMGVGMFGHISYSVDAKTGRETIYSDTTKKDKPKTYSVNLKDIIGIHFSNSFLSVLLFNNHFVKKILEEEASIIQKAMGNYYIHTFIYQLMLLKYPKLQIIRFNEIIVKAEVSRHPQFHIKKDKVFEVFKVFYVARRKLNDLLRYNNYASSDYKKILADHQKKLKKNIVKEMGMIKAFDSFNSPFFVSLKLFFRQAPLADALCLSFFFVVFYITPSFVVKELYLLFIKIKHKEHWQKVWLDIALKHET